MCLELLAILCHRLLGIDYQCIDNMGIAVELSVHIFIKGKNVLEFGYLVSPFDRNYLSMN